MTLKISIAYLLVFLTLSLFASAQQKADDILGVWFNEEKTGKIEVYKDNNKYMGKIVWVDLKPEDSGFDENNPDPQKRKQPLQGLLILKGFEYEEGEYVDGEIYDPKNGKTYSCYMKLETKDKLFVRGFIGLSLIGRTTYWTRVKD